MDFYFKTWPKNLMARSDAQFAHFHGHGCKSGAEVKNTRDPGADFMKVC